MSASASSHSDEYPGDKIIFTYENENHLDVTMRMIEKLDQLDHLDQPDQPDPWMFSDSSEIRDQRSGIWDLGSGIRDPGSGCTLHVVGRGHAWPGRGGGGGPGGGKLRIGQIYTILWPNHIV